MKLKEKIIPICGLLSLIAAIVGCVDFSENVPAGCWPILNTRCEPERIIARLNPTLKIITPVLLPATYEALIEFPVRGKTERRWIPITQNTYQLAQIGELCLESQ